MTWQTIIFSIALLSSTATFGTNNPTIISVALEKSYVPIGFDDNDKVQLIVNGVFPSTCYKVATVRTAINAEQKTVHIWQTAYYYTDASCTQMTVPFTQVVDVGLIGAGEYTLYDGTSEKQIGTLPITRSTNPGPDDFLYAPINDAFLVVDAVGRKTLVLMGQFSDRCTRLKDVQVHYFPEVIVVQPIAERIGGERCGSEIIRFTKHVELDSVLDGTYLLHVRSMNGQAINKMVDTHFIQ